MQSITYFYPLDLREHGHLSYTEIETNCLRFIILSPDKFYEEPQKTV